MIIHRIESQHKYNKEQRSTVISFNDCGLIHAKKNWLHKKRFLEKYELIYVTEGSLHLYIDNAQVTLAEDDLIVIAPYKTIGGFKKSSTPTAFFWADFITDDAEHFGISTKQIHINQPDKIRALLEDLMSASQQKNINDYTLDSFLLFLFHHINTNAENNSHQQLIVHKISNYIEEHISEPLTVDTIADVFKYNKDYISRLFKNFYGISLKNYINKQKINLSKKLLTTSNYTVKDISNLLGYNDSNLFTKFFKYHENMSPSDFRNQA